MRLHDYEAVSYVGSDRTCYPALSGLWISRVFRTPHAARIRIRFGSLIVFEWANVIGTTTVDRRSFLMLGGSSISAALVAAIGHSNVLFARDRAASSSALEQRLADVIAAYDAQGNHRTGTAVDNASAEWLAKLVQQIGVEAELESFPFSRVDPKSCYLQIADRRIEGVPLFDAAFTQADGVRGRSARLGSDADIGLAETEPFSLMEPRRAQAELSRKHVGVATRQWSCLLAALGLAFFY